MPLYNTYRPQKLDEVFGNESVKISIMTILAREDKPRAWLFTGQSGTGKTTMARIVANELGCHERDYQELNIADARGIDDARKLIGNMAYLPQGRFEDGSNGKVRAFVLDECFARNTMISTPCGQIPIDMVSIGQTLYNLTGIGQVEKVFQNKVPLHKVARISFSDGSVTFCSINHQYMGGNGWKEALRLKKNFIFKRVSTIMNKKEIHYGRTEMLETKNSEELHYLQERIHYQKPDQADLFQSLCKETSLREELQFIQRSENLQNLWKTFYLYEKRTQTYLRQKLWSKEKKCPTWLYGPIQDSRMGGTKQGKFSQMEAREPRSLQEFNFQNFSAHEGKQPFMQARSYRESQNNQNYQWFTPYMERRTGRQWQTDYTTDSTGKFHRLASRSGNITWPEATWLSYLLQGGYWKSSPQDSHRSGREWAQWEGGQISRLEERGQVERIGVENVEIYQPGNNDGHFLGIIEDRERSQGYVNFYDLQVSGHHSYFANDHLVHNCQQATGPFQQAILKSLEDTPAHVVFILCTTDPDRLLKTIRTRCSTFEMKPLAGPVMSAFINNILGKEGLLNFPHKAIDAIIEASDGSPRQALVLLDKVIDITDDQEMIEAIQSSQATEATTKDLCQALLAKKDWAKVVAPIIKGLGEGEDWEKVRRAVLGYAAAVLLGNDNAQAATIIECFRSNLYDCGKAGLVLMAWRSLL